MMATLKDVAKESGLTVTTVSRVLNNRGYISDSTRNKVHIAMKKLNYRPNEVARSLSRQKSNTIGVIVPHITHPFFAELISHLEIYAFKKGYKILLCNSQDRDEKEREYFAMCSSNRVAGIILCSGSVELNEFDGGDFPIVTIERYLDNGSAAVECDNEEGGRLVAEHLIKCGCKNLLNFSGIFKNSMPADTRTLAFGGVCEAHGIAYKPVITNLNQYNHLDYYDEIEAQLRENPDVDGIFASSDIIAAQVIQACAKLGKRVPEDIKVVGFDDVNLASLISPKLTTIHQPIKEMARTAVDLLVAASSGKIVAKRTILPVELIKRETT